MKSRADYASHLYQMASEYQNKRKAHWDVLKPLITESIFKFLHMLHLAVVQLPVFFCTLVMDHTNWYWNLPTMSRIGVSWSLSLYKMSRWWGLAPILYLGTCRASHHWHIYSSSLLSTFIWLVLDVLAVLFFWCERDCSVLSSDNNESVWQTLNWARLG